MIKSRSPQAQVAFDSGGGQRGISHRRENPYDADIEPDMHAAWEEGWQSADREANSWKGAQS